MTQIPVTGVSSAAGVGVPAGDVSAAVPDGHSGVFSAEEEAEPHTPDGAQYRLVSAAVAAEKAEPHIPAVVLHRLPAAVAAEG